MMDGFVFVYDFTVSSSDREGQHTGVWAKKFVRFAPW